MSLRARLRLPHKVAVDGSRRLGALAPRWFAARVRRPHFIVGCGRSGTTMLNALFDRHPEVANFPTEANPLWHPTLYPWHAAGGDAPPFFVDPRAFTRASLAARRPADDARLRATFGAFQSLARRPVFLNKTVMVTFMLDRVLELFPDARFIHLFRDARPVALSWVVKEAVKLTQPRYAARGFRFERDELLEIYARHWSEHIEALAEVDARLGLAASGRLFELSYEALCADPKGGLTGMAEFLGVSPAPFLASDLSHLRDSNHKARAELGPALLARLTAAARPGLVSKGYGEDIA